MATANEQLLDLQLQRAVLLQRFTNAQVRRIVELLAQRDAAFAEWLQRQLERAPRSLRAKGWRQLQKKIDERRRELMREVRKQVNSELVDYAKDEAKYGLAALLQSVPVQLSLAAVPASKLRAALFNTPFAEGQLLANTWRTLAAADRRRLISTIQLGIVQGLDPAVVVRQIVGSRATGYRDGMLAITRRDTEAVVRTAYSHAANTARDALWRENADVVEGIMWLSTLDGRTTLICISRDGAVAPLHDDARLPAGRQRLKPPTARPPAHYRCRSTTVAIISVDGIVRLTGDRPFVRDARTRRFRERDFRAEARARAGETRWSKWSRSERTSAVRRARERWAREAIGQVPATETYPTWLRRQPPTFVADVLGRRRADLFLDGKLRVDQMVNQFGDELTLEQLSQRHPGAF